MRRVTASPPRPRAPARPAARARWLLPLAAAVLAGCASLAPPDAALPPDTVPARWTHAGIDQPQPTDLAGWWQRFDDATLTALVQQALAANPSVHGALAALRQSRALADVARAGYSPSLGGSASAQRSRSGHDDARNSFGLGLDASWEPDLFGATRAGVGAAEADARAAALSLADLQVSLAAEVALATIDLRHQQARLSIAQANLAAQDDTLQIARWRQQAGLVSALDVEQASAAAEQTRAQLPLLQTALDQARHRLAVLTGRAPGTLADLGAAPVPLPPDDLVAAFPADTLRQRPDVRRAEAQMQAAWARVAQADAARYPSLRLSGSLGLQALTLGDLFSGGALVRSILAGLSAPIFDGGAIAGRVQAQRAAFDQARAGYQSSVLAALQEVEDALVALRGDRARIDSLQAAAAAAERADALARQQYQAGLIDFNAVLNSQRTLLSAQDAQASVRASLAADHVRLYKALGGGWKAQEHPPEALMAPGACCQRQRLFGPSVPAQAGTEPRASAPSAARGGTSPVAGGDEATAIAGMACSAAIGCCLAPCGRGLARDQRVTGASADIAGQPASTTRA